jgi:hypothetical protein
MSIGSVPERIDPKKLGLRSESLGAEISGKDPSFHYEWKSMEPNHPQYVEKYLRPYEIGRADVGFFPVAAWEVVKNEDVIQGKKRADDGKGVDTTTRHGRTVLCRLPNSEWVKHETIDRLIDGAQSKMLAPARQDGSHVSVRGGVVAGNTEDGALDASIANITR